MAEKKMVDLDGLTPCRINAEIVECIRVESGEGIAFVALHTTEGFGVALQPPVNLSLNEFYLHCLKVLWPPEPKTTTRRK